MWNHLGIAIGRELLVTVVGVVLSVQATPGMRRTRRAAVLLLVGLLALVTSVQLVTTRPPSGTAAA